MMLRNSKEYQVAFAKLGDCHGVIDDATFEQIDEFLCQMYTALEGSEMLTRYVCRFSQENSRSAGTWYQVENTLF